MLCSCCSGAGGCVAVAWPTAALLSVQAMADYAGLIWELREELGDPDVPVIGFGGWVKRSSRGCSAGLVRSGAGQSRRPGASRCRTAERQVHAGQLAVALLTTATPHPSDSLLPCAGATAACWAPGSGARAAACMRRLGARFHACNGSGSTLVRAPAQPTMVPLPCRRMKYPHIIDGMIAGSGGLCVLLPMRQRTPSSGCAAGGPSLRTRRPGPSQALAAHQLLSPLPETSPPLSPDLDLSRRAPALRPRGLCRRRHARRVGGGQVGPRLRAQRARRLGRAGAAGSLG